MSHTYLLDIYALIDKRLEKLSAKQVSERPQGDGASFQQGQIDILVEFKQFLAQQYNSKLPRRIRNKFSG